MNGSVVKTERNRVSVPYAPPRAVSPSPCLPLALSLAFAVCVLILSATANAQTQTILFLGEKEPLVIAFELKVGDRSHTDAWKAGLSEIVHELDRDKTGTLSRAETELEATERRANPTEPSPARAEPSRERVKATLAKRTMSPQAEAFLKTANLWDADAEPKDGELSLDEIAKFLAREGQGAFQAQTSKTTSAILSPQPIQVNNSGTRLWDWLDENDDGELTAKELRSARETLQKYDLDSDESISLNELVGSENPFFSARLPNQTMESPFFAAPEGASSTKVARKLIAQYGTPKEIPKETKPENAEEASEDASKRTKPHGVELDVLKVPKDRHAEFDRDGDGMLDHWELRAYLKAPVPMVTIEVTLPTSESAEPMVSGSVKDPKSEVIVKKSTAGTVSVLAGEIQIEVETGGLSPESLLESLDERFTQIDRNNNGYLEPPEVENDDLFRQLFNQHKGDDDNLYPQEWRPPIEAQIRFARTQTRMAVQDGGQDVYSVLDGDRSLKITPREWLDAADRLSVWDKNGSGTLEQSEVPHVYRVSFGPGLPDLPGLVTPSNNNQQTPMVQQVFRGPKWFQAMDKNGDGDVSEREFLGPPNVFGKIDLDEDKLIDPREAAKFSE